jgi:hypothetical protein
VRDFFCTVCQSPIEPKRVLKGKSGSTCGPECARTKRNEIRAYKARVRCRLCGRRGRSRREPEVESRPCANEAQPTVGV